MLEPWMVIALLAVAAICIAIGYAIGRSQNNAEDELKQAEEELTQYKEQVAQHFGKTAELFDKLTHDYRDVYEHLAQSSENLCGDQVPRISADKPDGKLLAGGDEVEAASVAVEPSQLAEDDSSAGEASKTSVKTHQAEAASPTADPADSEVAAESLGQNDSPVDTSADETPVTAPPAAEAVDADIMSADDDSTGVSKKNRG